MSAVTTYFPPQQVYRFTVEQYHKMIEDGLLTEDDPVELIEGVILFKMPKNDPHIISVRRCRRAIESVLPPECFYDAEQPITLGDSEPEPDGMVVIGSFDDAKLAKPGPRELALVIEVADSSLERDRGIKLRSYARAGIFCYWIVNLVDRQIEVYTQANATAEVPTYTVFGIFKPGDLVALHIAGHPVSHLSVSDLLPNI